MKFWPLSLARKVQVTFGAAVVLVLVLALSILYIWMGQLTKKDMFDTGRARSKVLLDRHFQLKDSTQTLPPLDTTGQTRDANDSEISWVRFTEEGQNELSLLSDEVKKIIETLRNDPDRDENILMTKRRGQRESNYVRIFKAADEKILEHIH
ncbi:hypothetical protein ACFL5Z_15385, partial [Planctomycetota bacterium]